MRSPRARLLDMIEAIEAVDKYSIRGREVYDREELVRVWIHRHLQILGEAAGALPHDLRSLAPAVPWRRIIDMRNVLAHGYFGLDDDILWGVAEWELAPAPARGRSAAPVRRRRAVPLSA